MERKVVKSELVQKDPSDYPDIEKITLECGHVILLPHQGDIIIPEKMHCPECEKKGKNEI